MALKIIDDSHKYTTVKAGEHPGSGGARHHYFINIKPEFLRLEQHERLLDINFQDGPIKESGINGIMDENLIAILIDRLEGFQSGPYKCLHNQEALDSLKYALEVLQERTKIREKQGIEGTHQVGEETEKFQSGQIGAAPTE